MGLEDCRRITLPKITDERGTLTFAQSGSHVPFEIERVFYLYDLAPSTSRGAHAHKECHQLLIAVKGGCEVVVDDGRGSVQHTLNDPAQGLWIPPKLWAIQKNFAPGSVLLVLASHVYDEGDYWRDYAEFQKAITSGKF